MPIHIRISSRFAAGFVAATLVAGLLFVNGLRSPALAADEKLAPPIEMGQRVFSCGHSFHVFVPDLLADMARGAQIKDHVQVGLSAIGGSRVIQHWDVSDEQNKAQAALRAGNVDVLTLSPIHLPDAGIENFMKLGLEHNPEIRVTVQENWLPFDIYDTTFTKRPAQIDHNAPTAEELKNLHEPYFRIIDEHVQELNKKYGRQVVFVAPVGQAVIALREKIIAFAQPVFDRLSCSSLREARVSAG